MTTTEQEVECPKCGGRMWDNRDSKKNPKAPDFKCRTRSCDGVIWPPKGGNGKQPISYGKMDWEEEQDEAERRFASEAKAGAAQGHSSGNHSGRESAPASAPASPVRVDALNNLLNAYGICFAHAVQLTKAEKCDADVSAMAATMFIAAKDKGLV